ncbi:aspartate kinase [Dokdonia sp.]|uniref:aspartate kinase n=1 Tax=Dokdonia sp. TaxID=2024995 RepID=UPI00326546E5
MSSTINIAIFGIGNVGSTLIAQIADFNTKTKGTKINLFAIANSKQVLLDHDIASFSWEDQFKAKATSYEIDDVFAFAKANSLENLLVVDVTASAIFVENYLLFIQEGFHIVTANKIANTLSFDFYQELRNSLITHKKQFYYETNVGAGLPVIETIKNLHHSGEEIYKIRGVFSGSLSYLFNTFSKEEKAFSEILLEADALGLTEPDAREDLSGKDVARKLLILGRELGLDKEVQDVKVQSLVPATLNGKTTVKEFRQNIKKLDPVFKTSKDELGKGEVLRHVGELDLKTRNLEVKLIQEPRTTALGQTKGADAIFEIYTKSYGEHPLVIQGAGAGKSVTARGVLSDILKVAQSLN